ncbi:MAG: DVU0524 family FlgM-associated protein [Desulfobacterales bacterium]
MTGADNKPSVKIMVISAYQINNVLRVYGEQLRRGRISKRQRSSDTDAPDKISISARARRETIIDDMTSNIIERLTQFEPHDSSENELSDELEIEHGKPLTHNEGRHNEIIFKEIDVNGETINSFSLEDAKSITNKSKETTKDAQKKI